MTVVTVAKSQSHIPISVAAADNVVRGIAVRRGIAEPALVKDGNASPLPCPEVGAMDGSG